MTDLNGLRHPYGVIVEELEETAAVYFNRAFFQKPHASQTVVTVVI